MAQDNKPPSIMGADFKGDDPLMPHCKTCKFYSPKLDRPGCGDCRLNPPNVFMVAVPVAGGIVDPKQGPQLKLQFPDAWPLVSDDNWCGQHQNRSDAHTKMH